jgi:hypothetical protein
MRLTAADVIYGVWMRAPMGTRHEVDIHRPLRPRARGKPCHHGRCWLAAP